MPVIYKNKLVLKDLGEPSMVKTMEGANAKYILGTIFGIATGVKRRTDKVDPTKTYESLIGNFEGVPADTTKDGIGSGTLYLPEGIQNMIATKLEGENAADSVQFALEISTVKATNAAGYAWAVQPKVKVDSADPLAALREQVLQALPAPDAKDKAPKTK